jgi:hypothetical protein
MEHVYAIFIILFLFSNLWGSDASISSLSADSTLKIDDNNNNDNSIIDNNNNDDIIIDNNDDNNGNEGNNNNKNNHDDDDNNNILDGSNINALSREKSLLSTMLSESKIDKKTQDFSSFDKKSSSDASGTSRQLVDSSLPRRRTRRQAGPSTGALVANLLVGPLGVAGGIISGFCSTMCPELYKMAQEPVLDAILPCTDLCNVLDFLIKISANAISYGVSQI